MTFASYETLDLESWLHDLSILILWHIVGLSHLISIEFQSINTNLGILPKDFFFFFNCYNIAIREATLTEIFSTKY
jgi:hypothetical protein